MSNESINFTYQISYPDFDPSDAITSSVEKHLEKLGRHYDRITSCHVTVGLPHKHAREKIFHVHVDLEIPGRGFHVNREPEKNYAHKDVNVAVRDAFRALTRQLMDHLSEIKKH